MPYRLTIKMVLTLSRSRVIFKFELLRIWGRGFGNYPWPLVTTPSIGLVAEKIWMGRGPIPTMGDNVNHMTLGGYNWALRGEEQDCSLDPRFHGTHMTTEGASSEGGLLVLALGSWWEVITVSEAPWRRRETLGSAHGFWRSVWQLITGGGTWLARACH